MSLNMVKFTKLRTAIDPSFWAKLAELKLDKYKLEDKTEISIWSGYSLDKAYENRTSPMILDCTSFNENVETTSLNGSVVCTGILINTNTFESFRQTQPDKFIDSLGKHLKDAIIDGTALKEPWRLTLFLLLSYADLKKHRFHYWAAYPTLFNLPEIHYDGPRTKATEILSSSDFSKLQTDFNNLDSKFKSFFAILLSSDGLKIMTLFEGVTYVNSSLVKAKETSCVDQKLYFAFYDPCDTLEPGWPLRNLLCLLFYSCPDFTYSKTINILSLRGKNLESSIIFSIKTKGGEKILDRKEIIEGRLVGWEANVNGKMGPNIADLSESLDPNRMAARAVGLNLKLMKWRLVPDLDLEKVSKLRCLLLGAGTLGCSVARVLIGWGIKNITFVDSSTVSHSNTVRQTRWLPTLLCAVFDKMAINAALGFDSYTVQRHGTRRVTVATSPDLTQNCPSGEDLGCYFCNDVTQPGNASFISQADRTLDQQCTVSRPGLSSIAAGLAVELMIAVTQHSKGIGANAFMDDGRNQYRSSERESCEGLLGLIPHTLRGSLWNYEMRLTITHRFPSCTACSIPIINEYRKRGFDFILDACNQPNYLERIAGLEDLLKRPNLDELCYAIDSSDEDSENISLTKV
ncbi:Similar to ATG7: Ubiquitin-like modifier-activating enzyme ATG7 (Gallus gallus) [Cotesia congregata]|uniref:Similar to ATG7: Ubiquitin-like modifier-activating enzyme ATG7 (Gallus gallus) n=1 Tax=Cotesia congregata TaxID=51543 RepID=A0A8J2MQK7_COTCN|nr:Similar to ATG7: Ubiquitin-like modifier-activating enzyme ATG7 (Gallus gallus) [Cotesia congregata]